MLENIKDEAERSKAFKAMLNQFYAMGKVINMASYMDIDSLSELRKMENLNSK